MRELTTGPYAGAAHGPDRRRRDVVREVVRGLAAAGAAYVGMAVLAAAGLWLAGARGSLVRLTAATVALAAGGRADVTGTVIPGGPGGGSVLSPGDTGGLFPSGAGGLLPGGTGTLSPGDAGGLVSGGAGGFSPGVGGQSPGGAGGGLSGGLGGLFSGGAGGRFEVGLRGELRLMPLGVTLAGVLVLVLLLRRRADGARLCGTGVRLCAAAVALPAVLTLTALAGRGRLSVRPPCVAYVARCASAPRDFTLAYHVDVSRTLLGAVLGMLVILAVALLPRYAPWLRPALSATLGVVAGLALLVTAAAPVVAAFGRGAKGAGVALLVAPNAVFAALSAGLGVPWSFERTSAPGHLGLAVAFAVAVLLAIGVLAAARTTSGPLWVRAVSLAPVAGVTVAALTALAGASARLSVGVLGFAFPVIEVRAAGDILMALVLGSAAGALAGLAGGAVRAGWDRRSIFS